MRNKAELYKLSRPHNTQTSFDYKTEFRVLLGTYEKSRPITIEAYNLNLAIADATNLCEKDEEVLEISKDGRILWKHPSS
jgi:hypothetical protein